MSPINTRILLARYGNGIPQPDWFRMEHVPLEPLAEGEVRVRTLWLGLDPFPRLQMTGKPGGPPQLPLDQVMIGRGIGEVIESRRPDAPVGALLLCDPGWQAFATLAGPLPPRIDDDTTPLQAALDVLGPAGLTAWCTLLAVGQLQPGERVVITAAAGAVGSTAVQIAQQTGAEVVAVAGGAEQCTFLRDTLGVGAVLDYQAHDDLPAALAALCPQGFQLALDTVGGAHHDALLRAAAPRARLVMAGFISGYGGARVPCGDPTMVVLKRLQLTGFLLADHAAQFATARAQLAGWLATGALRRFETITEGLEQAPAAFARLFGTAAPGKQLVRVASFGGDEE